MKLREYRDLDLEIEPLGTMGAKGERYVARVLESPSGPASTEFEFPLSPVELAQFIVAVGPPRVSARRLVAAVGATVDARDFGRRLCDAVFSGEVNLCFRLSLALALAEDKGLRIRLRLGKAPALDGVPWEYLFSAPLNRFLATSQETPIVRYLDSVVDSPTLLVKPPLRVLVMVSSPSDAPPLEVDREIELLRTTTADLVDSGLLELVFLEDATLSALQHKLYEQFHVFHFIGHGGFDSAAQEGVLVFETDTGSSHRVSGSALGTLLHDARGLQLAVINACEGARTSGEDPFSGVGQLLVQQGLPAVVAMQLEISDKAALGFSHEFYFALCQGQAVDAAMSEARKALFGWEEDAEWGTPVLLRSAADQPFELATAVAAPAPQPRWDSMLATAKHAVEVGATTTAMPILEQLTAEQPDWGDATVLLDRAREPDAGPQPGTSQAEPVSRPVAEPLPLAGGGDEPPDERPAPGATGGSGGSAKAGGSGRTTKLLVAGAAVVAAVAAVALAVALFTRDNPVSTAAVTGQTSPNANVTTENGASAGVPPRARATVRAAFSAAGQTIDGQVDDWAGRQVWGSANQVFPKPGAATGLSGRWWLAWNQHALFVYTVVADAAVTPVRADPSQAWKGDSLSFEFGADPRGLASGAVLRGGDLHLMLGVSEGGQVTAAVNPSRRGIFVAGGRASDVQATTWTVPGGYAVEAAIPWSVLKVGDPRAGATFAMNLDVSDAAPDGELGTMVSSNPARSVSQNRPALWDLLVLGGGKAGS